GHVGVHEAERAVGGGDPRRHHPDTADAHHDAVAGAYPVHRDRPHDRGATVVAAGDHEPAVHLRVLHAHPAAVEADVGGQVGGAVESGGQHAVDRGELQHRVAGGAGVDAV